MYIKGLLKINNGLWFLNFKTNGARRYNGCGHPLIVRIIVMIVCNEEGNGNYKNHDNNYVNCEVDNDNGSYQNQIMITVNCDFLIVCNKKPNGNYQNFDNDNYNARYNYPHEYDFTS